MGIDPMLYQKYSGGSGDPHARLGEALAKNESRALGWIIEDEREVARAVDDAQHGDARAGGRVEHDQVSDGHTADTAPEFVTRSARVRQA